MRIKSWNILTFVLVLLVCNVFFVCLNSMLGMHTICVARAYDGDLAGVMGLWSSEWGTGIGLGYTNLMGWYRPPSQLELAVRAAGRGDITALTKYTNEIGISYNGQLGSTYIAYPTVAGMTVPSNDLGYPMSIPYTFSRSQATRDWIQQNMGWLTVGTLYDLSEMNKYPMFPSSIYSPFPVISRYMPKIDFYPPYLLYELGL